MRIIAKKALKDFWERGPLFADAQKPLEAWYDEARRAIWKNSAEVRAQFGTASVVGKTHVVFNIHSNKYRLVVKINYQIGIIFIRFIGTHKEYDKIDAKEV